MKKSLSKDPSACVVNQFTVDGVLYEITVFEDDVLNFPHCHVINENGFECSVRFDRPEYVIYKEHIGNFSKQEEVDAFNKSIRSLPDDVDPYRFPNAWVAAIFYWNLNHSNRIGVYRGIPDYTQLPLTVD